MSDKPHPEMGYRSCLGIIRLAGRYSQSGMEAAAERALLMGACRYQSVKSILKTRSTQCLPWSLLPRHHRRRTTTSVARSISTKEKWRCSNNR